MAHTHACLAWFAPSSHVRASQEHQPRLCICSFPFKCFNFIYYFGACKRFDFAILSVCKPFKWHIGKQHLLFIYFFFLMLRSTPLCLLSVCKPFEWHFGKWHLLFLIFFFLMLRSTTLCFIVSLIQKLVILRMIKLHVFLELHHCFFFFITGLHHS